MTAIADAKRSSENDRGQHADRAQADTGQSAHRLREAGERGASAAGQATDAFSQAARDTAAQGRDVIDAGIRMMTRAQAPLADAGYHQSRRLIESSARVTDAYREAAERSAEDAQALIAACTSIGRGLQQWNHACLDLVSQSVERSAQKRQAFLQCNSVVDLAHVQRDLYLDTIDGLFTSSTTLLQLAGRIAHDALRPLQDRARESQRA